MGKRIATAIMAVAILAAYVWFPPGHQIPPLQNAAKALGPYGYTLIIDTLFIILPLTLLALLRRGLPAAFAELGLSANPIRPLFFGFVATAPAWIGLAATCHVATKFTAYELILLCWYLPFCEEVIFRAFAFGQLYRRAGLNFWLAALVPAVLFACGHLYQSHKLAELAGILLITGTGSVMFSYFFVRFGWNVWAPFALHAFLNTWWMVFTTNQNALGGGWSDNVFRFGSIALAFGLVYGARHFRAFRIFAPQAGAFRNAPVSA